jgi:hypothetical protein
MLFSSFFWYAAILDLTYGMAYSRVSVSSSDDFAITAADFELASIDTTIKTPSPVTPSSSSASTPLS